MKVIRIRKRNDSKIKTAWRLKEISFVKRGIQTNK